MKELGENVLVHCWSFLDLTALARLEGVCKDFLCILNSQSGRSLFESIDLSTSGKPSVSWLMRKLETYHPKELILKGCSLGREEIMTLLRAVGVSLSSLDLSYTDVKRVDIREIATLCPNLSAVRVDKRCKDDHVLNALLSLSGLKRLSVRDNAFLKGLVLAHSNTALEEFCFEDCQHFDYEAVYALASRSTATLAELSIDGEAYSTDDVCRLVSLLPHLTKFSVSFATDMTNSLLHTLTGYNWRSLCLKKGLAFTSSGFQSFFSAPYPDLQSLELIECQELDDVSLLLIAEQCPKLTLLNVNWCSEVSDAGLGEIVKKCGKMRRMELVGLKQVTDKAFPLDQEYEMYEHLLSLNFSKSDYVTDEHLSRLSYKYPQIEIKNYYGEPKDNWRHSK